MRFVRQLSKSGLTAVALWLATSAVWAEAPIVRPYEVSDTATPLSQIDTLVRAKLKEQGIQPANLCSDEVFVRRVFLDVTGTLPKADEAARFIQDQKPNKRTLLIDDLLTRDEFTDYWTMKWSDLLRVKSEFPINLWPNAVQSYHRWIHDSIHQNKPYDQFARELLTSSGSNFRVGPANFYRAVQARQPSFVAEAVALTFMGTRLSKWPAPARADMTAFFSRVMYKATDEWKEEIVCNDPGATTTISTRLPDGTPVKIKPEDDPRLVFADWLVNPKNVWFNRNIANRTWSWLMGRGIIDEPDDIRQDNPPSNPELLAYLETELVKSRYDLRHLFRLILNSRTYQQSSIPQSSSGSAEALFAYYPVRRIDAEVLIDAFCALSKSGEQYQSPIPEPFTFIPEYERTVTLADGSINSSFLELFGRPARDSGLESERNNVPNEGQRMYLLNSNDIRQRMERFTRTCLSDVKNDRREFVSKLYLSVLSRYPTDSELLALQTYVKGQRAAGARLAPEDISWALVNSKEFLYRH